GVELVRAVRCFAEQNKAGVADQAEKGLVVVARAPQAMCRFGDRFIDDRTDAARHPSLPSESKCANVSVKVTLEPAFCQMRGARQRSRLFEQMRCARDELELFFAPEVLIRRSIQGDNSV